jgi:DNA polymerase-3 subunit alpha
VGIHEHIPISGFKKICPFYFWFLIEDIMKYPLCNYTHYSLLKGFSKPKQLSKKCVENEYPACGISDYKSISGAVSFYKTCKDNNIKPIIGCSFDHYILFAKNKQGWFDLIEIVSSLSPEGNEYFHITENICKRGNLICLTHDKSPCDDSLTFKHNPLTTPSHYVEKDDAHLHRILLCSAMKTTLPKVNTLLRSGKLEQNKEFFIKDTFYVKSNSEMPDDEYGELCLEKIYNLCEDYEILNPPMLPKFPTPTGQSEEEYLKQLCRNGWVKFLSKTGKVDKEGDKQKYLDRFTTEFDVINQAKLFGYFLIVQDIIRYVKSQGWLAGPGRGCFLPDTKVKMSDGLYKHIANVQVGDTVVDAFGDIRRVYDTLCYDVDEEILELEFENGKIVRCTQDHKFLTNNRGWVQAKDLLETDDIAEV